MQGNRGGQLSKGMLQEKRLLGVAAAEGRVSGVGDPAGRGMQTWGHTIARGSLLKPFKPQVNPTKASPQK